MLWFVCGSGETPAPTQSVSRRFLRHETQQRRHATSRLSTLNLLSLSRLSLSFIFLSFYHPSLADLCLSVRLSVLFWCISRFPSFASVFQKYSLYHCTASLALGCPDRYLTLLSLVAACGLTLLSFCLLNGVSPSLFIQKESGVSAGFCFCFCFTLI